MTRQNVDVVRRMLQAFNDGDLEAIVAECDPTVEWEEQSIPGVEHLYRGCEGVRRWWAAVVLEEALGSIEGRLEGLREADDTVIASLRLEGEGGDGPAHGNADAGRARLDLRMDDTSSKGNANARVPDQA